MGDEQYLWPTRWPDFQHYTPERDRGPAWIKAYTKQLVADDYTDLTLRRRGLLGDLRLLFGLSRGWVRADAEILSKRLLARVQADDLASLNHAGFLDIVSRETLELRLEELYASRARAKKLEVEVDKEVARETPALESAGSRATEKTTPKLLDAAALGDPHETLLAHARRIAAEWNGQAGSDVFDERLDELEQRHHGKLRALERDDLWNRAFQRR